MSNRGTASQFGRYVEFQAAVLRQLPRPEEMADETLAQWIDGQGDLKSALRKALLPPDINWAEVYMSLGMASEYSAEIAKLAIPSDRPDLWVVPVIAGVTCNKVVAGLRGLGMTVSTYVDDLDAGVPVNDRNTDNGSYAVGFRRTIEADEENKNLSADILKASGHKSITLLERLLLEQGYFLATRQHLDVENVTLCAGSRYSGGDVPDVFWYPDTRRVYVYWCNSDSADDSLRSRSAVSVTAQVR